MTPVGTGSDDLGLQNEVAARDYQKKLGEGMLASSAVASGGEMRDPNATTWNPGPVASAASSASLAVVTNGRDMNIVWLTDTLLDDATVVIQTVRLCGNDPSLQPGGGPKSPSR
jgi:hypothetical protein